MGLRVPCHHEKYFPSFDPPVQATAGGQRAKMRGKSGNNLLVRGEFPTNVSVTGEVHPQNTHGPKPTTLIHWL